MVCSVPVRVSFQLQVKYSPAKLPKTKKMFADEDMQLTTKCRVGLLKTPLSRVSPPLRPTRPAYSIHETGTLLKPLQKNPHRWPASAMRSAMYCKHAILNKENQRGPKVIVYINQTFRFPPALMPRTKKKNLRMIALQESTRPRSSLSTHV